MTPKFVTGDIVEIKSITKGNHHFLDNDADYPRIKLQQNIPYFGIVFSSQIITSPGRESYLLYSVTVNYSDYHFLANEWELN